MLKNRSYQAELLDDFEVKGKDLNRNLEELELVNRWLGGRPILKKGIDISLKKGFNFTKLVDLGCGGGDLLEYSAELLKEKRENIEYLGYDLNKNVLDFANERVKHKSIKFIHQDAMAIENFKADNTLYLATLFFHHFTEAQIIEFLKSFKSTKNSFLIVNDLHRHHLAYISIKVLTQLFSSSKMVKNDAPLSVARAFKRTDWNHIFESAELKPIHFSWEWAFRWLVIFKSDQ